MADGIDPPRPDSAVPGEETVTLVPQTAAMPEAVLRGEHPWRLIIRYAPLPLLRDAFVRFRYADGFSHSRALALQLGLAVIPLVIAVVGLSGVLGTRSVGRVLQQTLLTLNPGSSEGAVMAALPAASGQGGAAPVLALCLGLLVAVVALTAAMGEVERGANRIYGLRTDRATPAKYGRALLVAFAAGVPALAGSLILVSASGVGDAVEQVYAVDDEVVAVVGLPLGVFLLLVSIAVMLRFSPRRTQLGWSWLMLGSSTGLLLWLLFTGLLATYLQMSGAFGTVYGPLTGIIALLLWAQLTSIALFLAFSVTAQLEAARPRRDG